MQELPTLLYLHCPFCFPQVWEDDMSLLLLMAYLFLHLSLGLVSSYFLSTGSVPSTRKHVLECLFKCLSWTYAFLSPHWLQQFFAPIVLNNELNTFVSTSSVLFSGPRVYQISIPSLVLHKVVLLWSPCFHVNIVNDRFSVFIFLDPAAPLARVSHFLLS